MEKQTPPLHLLFFPLMAHGHIIPALHMAKHFASNAVKTTMVTTPGNASLIKPSIAAANHAYSHPIDLVLLSMPPDAPGFREGKENLSDITDYLEHPKFVGGLATLREPLHRLLADLRPDAIVSDYWLHWTLDVSRELGIPRLVFHGTSFFALCAYEYLYYDNRRPEGESFLIPKFPRPVEMLPSEVPDASIGCPAFVELLARVAESDRSSYGVLGNSFYELEPEFADHYRRALGRKAWLIGPLSLCNKHENNYYSPGNQSENYIKWLDEKQQGSVVYVCFGSQASFSAAQMRELALALEACGSPFVWAARQGGAAISEWLPERYVERIEGIGMIVREWAPQTMILGHRAIGGFVTHCGWNSCLESIIAGVPMATWPLFAEQFYNEKLIVEVLQVGVVVGSKVYQVDPDQRPVLAAAEIEWAVRRLMGKGGDQADATARRRRKAKELSDLAKKAVGEGGSSYVDTADLIQELMSRRLVMDLQ